MNIDIEEENLILPKQTALIEKEMKVFLDNDEGNSIKADIELLNNMGFDKKMINKVYILLRPENIERAIDYMTEIDGIYQHDFISSSNPNEKTLCFICKKPKNNHLDYIPNNLLINEEENNNINNNNNNNIQIVEDIDKENDKENDNENDYDCEVCYDNVDDKELNTIPCGHLFCTHCWFNYLKTLITEAKVEKIKCMNHECGENIPEEFILKHLSDNNNLIEKYKKFKKRAEILQDNNKKLCPKPDCDSFLQKSNKSKYVKCERGHEFCFDCLRPPHGNDSCDNYLEKQLLSWTKGKRVKRCPRCKIYTEKNEGCNHMTCINCKYQWCWLCEGEYKYGHYSSGKCSGKQFVKADYLEDIKTYCGLHRIFKCVYPDGLISLYCSGDIGDELPMKYLNMLIFWLFGIFVIFFFIFDQYQFSNLDNISSCTNSFVYVIAILTGLTLCVPFQIALTCLNTPFILICFIYHKFFEKYLRIFGFEY